MKIPTAFFGHSMGALIAFELARFLRKKGAQLPGHLFVSGRRAPQLPDPMAPIHHLPEPDFIRAVGERYQPIPAPILGDREILELVLPALRADLKLVETATFTPDAPLAIPISAFGGTRDKVAAQPEIEAWSVHTAAAFCAIFTEGDHFFLTEPGAKRKLLDAIARDLGRMPA
jgi:medium-chain acyl-[acyl-carrier-protein] hydrolase